jgi:hypothetical protein
MGLGKGLARAFGGSRDEMADIVLIFPVSTDSALDYAQAARNRGDVVIGASSLPADPNRGAFDTWAFLPYFHAPDFWPDLLRLIRDHGVTLIHSPHLVVWQTLTAHWHRMPAGVRLDRTMPWHADLDKYRRQFRRAAAIRPWEFDCAFPPRPRLGETETAALVALTESAPGWCSVEKVLALAEIMRTAPQGDVVEIGVFCGKSATALAWTARHWNIGSLLCVDPWSAEAFVQDDKAVNQATATLDMDEIFRVFLTVMAWAGRDGWVNYRRMGADQAWAGYGPGAVHSAEMGTVEYRGRIAVLHVDGNHDEEQVRRDMGHWGEKVVPGGWIVVDDYVHAFGDGPRRAGDALLAERPAACSFVAGSALFVQLPF